MSLEKSNKIIKDKKGEKGFSTALLLNFSPYENTFKELGDGIENIRLNTSASAIHGECPQMANNFLSTDLLEKIDDSSPFQQMYNEKEERVGEIKLDNSYDNDSVLHSSEGEHSDDEEILSYHSNNPENTDPFQLQESNPILMEMAKQHNKLSSNSKLNEPKQNSNNKFIKGNKLGSNNNLPKKPPIHLYSYYNSTSKYLSEAFMNEHNKKMDNNTEKKPIEDSYINQGNLGFNPLQNGMMNYSLNNKMPYGNYMNEAQYHHQGLVNYPIGYYNNMNMNHQLQQEYAFKNKIQNKPMDYNYQMNIMNSKMEQGPGSLPGMSNYYPYMGIGDQSHFLQQSFPNNPNVGYPQEKLVQGIIQPPKQGIKGQPVPSNIIDQQQPVITSNTAEPKKKNKKKNKKTKTDDEYSIEMFGRIGWICDQCNNFNYETRNKCNRCGVTKSPKKVTKLKRKQEASKQQNKEMNPQTIISNERKSNERKGDWICVNCKNLNFSFRIICNRCQLPKKESDSNQMNNAMPMSNFNDLQPSMPMQNPNKTNQIPFNPQMHFINNGQIYFNNINISHPMKNTGEENNNEDEEDEEEEEDKDEFE